MRNLNTEVEGSGSDQHNPASELIQAPDRSDIQLARKRFGAFSKQRLSRLNSLLLPAQQQFLSLLPVLFHLNHPLLPGYGNANTPTGIDHFQINSGLKKRIEKYFFGLKVDDDRHKRKAIQCMYLIGSSGTLAQSHKSDLDCWLCFSSPLDQQAERALQEKYEKVSQWAMKFRLELHFFIMHKDSFRAKREATLGGEDCGGTQHFLLLDEFYRTGILIAGRAPTWWVVPSQPKDHKPPLTTIIAHTIDSSKTTDYAKVDSYYEQFSKQIIDGKFVKKDQFIDFGDTGVIPVSEFLSASVWTLYKAVQSPYKSVIKLLLIEAYIAQQGKHENLSEQLKNIIHTTSRPIASIDPYVEIYEHIENYLKERKQHARLEFLRQCFYHKVDIKLSQASDASTAWRHEIMSELVAKWGWSRQKCQDLENRQYQSIVEILQERKALSSELLSTYRYIDHLARESLSESDYEEHRYSRELLLLEQQLKVVYRHRQHKIGYRASETDAKLSRAPWKHLEILQSNEKWQLPDHEERLKGCRRTLPKVGGHRIVKSADSIVTLVIWAMQEGLACPSTEFYCRDPKSVYLEDQRPQFNVNAVINRITAALRKFYFDGISDKNTAPLVENNAQVDKCLILVNEDPKETAESLWDQVILSNKDDPLAYTGRPRNEIRSLSLVWSNTWGELFTHNFNGHNAIQSALSFYLSLERSRCCNLDITCISNERPRAITQRLKQLFEDVANWHKSAKPEAKPDHPLDKHPAFVFSTADGVYLINGPQYNPLSDNHRARDYWAFSKSVADIRDDIERLWQPTYDPLSFLASTALARGRTANP